MKVADCFKTMTATAGGIMLAGSAFAQDALPKLETVGKPHDRGIGFQEAVTEVARDLQWMDSFLMWIVGVITVFVTLLLLWVAFRFNSKRGHKPATFTHNTALEIGWTIVPILILLAIVPPSLTLLFKQLEIPEADVTIKATGNQWFWSYDYVDNEFAFDSFMLPREDLAAYGYAADEYLLATDTAVVVPVNKTVVLQVTGSDVIHAWAMPAFGVKQDGVPGRLAELWFKAEKEGVYFGQCSELCGKDHAYMPITVKVVSQAAYDEWLDGAIKEYAGTPREIKVAAK